MGEYLKPWRRKIGVVTLVMVCVPMGGWIRNRTYEDDIRVSIGDTDHIFESYDDNIRWRGLGPLDRDCQLEVEWITRPLLPPRTLRLLIHQGAGMAGSHYFDVVTVPYWSIVIPLTAISAWLLLSKPRPTKPPPIETAE
jgi:hypothetical protein